MHSLKMEENAGPGDREAAAAGKEADHKRWQAGGQACRLFAFMGAADYTFAMEVNRYQRGVCGMIRERGAFIR